MLFLRCLFRTKQGMDRALQAVDCNSDILLGLAMKHHTSNRDNFAAAWKAFLTSEAKRFMDPIWAAAKGAALDASKGKRPYDWGDGPRTGMDTEAGALAMAAMGEDDY